jgi:DNA-binding transcriptional regulator YdaS (Cro superfamily)
MRLAHYLAERHITEAQFAAWLGVPRDTVSLWMNGPSAPSPLQIAAIARATRGKVGPLDFPYKRRVRRVE